ncbi:MAG: GYD domain-containing protein [Hyphomicrobiales bacterium]
MAILITTARFTADGTQGAVVAPAERAEAAGRLIARIGGTLIGCYRTSGDDDVLLVFEAASYEEAVAALAAAAAGSGVIDLRTVRVLASHETKTPLPESRTGAAIRPSEGVNAAQRAAASRTRSSRHSRMPGRRPKRTRTPRRRRASWRRGKNPRKTSRPDARRRTTSLRRRRRLRRGPTPPMRVRTTMAP